MSIRRSARAFLSLSLFSPTLSFETTRCLSVPFQCGDMNFRMRRKLFLPPASPTLKLKRFLPSLTKTNVFSDSYIHALLPARTHVSSLREYLCFFFFLFIFSIVVNPKSKFYISRRIYSKRIFFRINRRVEKPADIRAVSICDSRGLLRKLRVWLAACMHRVYEI